jgi:hypothetical protein
MAKRISDEQLTEICANHDNLPYSFVLDLASDLMDTRTELVAVKNKIDSLEIKVLKLLKELSSAN